MSSKHIATSKLFWVNALTAGLAAADAVTPFLPPNALPYILGATAVTNVVLRAMTTQPVHIKRKPK